MNIRLRFLIVRIGEQPCSACSSTSHQLSMIKSSGPITKPNPEQRRFTSVCFILGLEALHLLLFAKDMKGSPLRAAFSGAFFSMVSSRTATRVGWGIAGWVNRRTMPRNPTAGILQESNNNGSLRSSNSCQQGRKGTCI